MLIKAESMQHAGYAKKVVGHTIFTKKLSGQHEQKG